MTEARFREWCRASGGDVGYGIGPEAMVNYQRTCERWGLQMLLLPETRIPEDEIAGFVFTDTPSKRFVERNPKLLREWARRQPNLEDGRPPGGRGNFSRRSTKRTLRESRPG